MENEKRKKKWHEKWWIWVIIILLIVVIDFRKNDSTPAGNEDATHTSNMQEDQNANDQSENTKDNSTESEKTTETETANTIEYTAELTSGNYTVGIDFPAGKYDITAISGKGSVRSSDLFSSNGINAMMGVGNPDLYVEEYKNVVLENGVILTVTGGVAITIYCDKASGEPLKEREQPNTETISLGSGNFVAGEDFPAGVYDIIAVSGKGTVQTDNMFDGGIYTTMGVDNPTLYESEYKNVHLSEGVTLTVERVNIKLVPSK